MPYGIIVNGFRKMAKDIERSMMMKKMQDEMEDEDYFAEDEEDPMNLKNEKKIKKTVKKDKKNKSSDEE